MLTKYLINLWLEKHWNFGNYNEWKIDKIEEFIVIEIVKILNELIFSFCVIFNYLKILQEYDRNSQ